MPQTPTRPTVDSATAAITQGSPQNESPNPRQLPRVRRLSTHESPEIIRPDITVQEPAIPSPQRGALQRHLSPPVALPSPSRTPPGYMEVDEDGEGSPDLDVPMHTPGMAADEDAVEAAMVVDDVSAVYLS